MKNVSLPSNSDPISALSANGLIQNFNTGNTTDPLSVLLVHNGQPDQPNIFSVEKSNHTDQLSQLVAPSAVSNGSLTDLLTPGGDKKNDTGVLGALLVQKGDTSDSPDLLNMILQPFHIPTETSNTSSTTAVEDGGSTYTKSFENDGEKKPQIVPFP